MKIPFSSKLQQKVKGFQKGLAAKSLILMYHRIGEAEIDPWHLCVTPQNFAAQLEVIQKYAHPLSLQELVQGYRSGKIQDRGVAITFDDGYADNFYHAKPVLENYGIPATIFVSTGYIGKKREFWWDELEQLLLQPKQLPNQLFLEINGSPYCWELGEAAYYQGENYQRGHTCQPWEAKPGSRLFFYHTMWQILQSLPESDRCQALADIRTWARIGSAARQTYLPLSVEEVNALAQGDLIEMGAHTVTHPFLSEQSLSQQRDEIYRSKVELEKIIQKPVTSFSYPFGNYTPQTIELTRTAGFECACSTKEDLVWRQSDCFQLPRCGVENCPGEQFSKQLERWFNG